MPRLSRLLQMVNLALNGGSLPNNIRAEKNDAANTSTLHENHVDPDIAKVILSALIGSAVGAVVWKKKFLRFAARCCNSPKLPKLDPNEWWGPNGKKKGKGKADSSIKPFKIEFSDQIIRDLKARLQGHRSLSPAQEGVGFEYGFNTKTLETWVKYWAEKYPFSERERFLNQYFQFKTNIQGLNIHFIHVKPEVTQGVEVVPILMMHGWPGSVREFYEAIPLLTKPRPGYNFVFELIIPSLPGYGFSDGAVRPGMGPPHIGAIFRNLMHRLGFKKYYIQGGDWGAAIASAMATFYPEDILGHHTNAGLVMNGCNMFKTLIGSIFPSMVVDSALADWMYTLSNFFSFVMEETGYMHIQSSKPDTVGVALTDSPAGLLAYILEKFSTWTSLEHSKVDGALEFRFTKDQLLDNLMIYWTTKSITTSMRLCSENFNKKIRDMGYESLKTEAPTWVLQAKHEQFYQPPSFIRQKYTNLIDTTVIDNGGHFFAFELPEVFTDDVFKAVKAFRKWNANKKTYL